MTDTNDTATKRFQCRHIHTEGRRCGSASLRGEEFCYFHHTSRKPVANSRSRRSCQSIFDLPLPEDRGAIQISLGEVLRRIATNAIDPRRAGLLLYGLQIAAINLPPHKPAKGRRDEESPVVEEIITHPTLGSVAPTLELPDPDAPRHDSLTAELLRAIRKGQEEIEAECRTRFEAELLAHNQPQPPSELATKTPGLESHPEPAILSTLDASTSEAVIPSEAEEPASRFCRCFAAGRVQIVGLTLTRAKDTPTRSTDADTATSSLVDWIKPKPRPEAYPGHATERRCRESLAVSCRDRKHHLLLCSDLPRMCPKHAEHRHANPIGNDHPDSQRSQHGTDKNDRRAHSHSTNLKRLKTRGSPVFRATVILAKQPDFYHAHKLPAVIPSDT